ncbi:hypothetical protein LINPERPRIM_LOCUS5924 [Linum perenne]
MNFHIFWKLVPPEWVSLNSDGLVNSHTGQTATWTLIRDSDNLYQVLGCVFDHLYRVKDRCDRSSNSLGERVPEGTSAA